MIRRTLLSTVIPFAAAVPGAGLADVTAEEVWSAYEAYTEALGLDVEATLDRSGQTLTVGDIVMTAPIPAEYGSFRMTVDGFDLVEQEDGSVSILYPETMEVGVSATVEEPEPADFDMTLEVGMTGSTAVASGTANDLRIESSTDRVTVSVADMTIEGDEDAAEAVEDFSLEVTIEDAQGTQSLVRRDGTMSLEAVSETGRSDYSTAIVLPEEGRSTTTGGSESTRAEITISIPESGVDYMNLAEGLRSGLSLRMETETIGSEQSSETLTSDMPATVQTTEFGRNAARVVFDETGLDVEGSVEDVSVFYGGIPGLPLDISAQIASGRGSAVIPLLASEEAQQAGYSITLEEVTIGDQIWRLFDPESRLPRDPASLKLELLAELTITEDLLDIEAMMAAAEAEEMPVELGSIALPELAFSALGVSLAGSGAFTLDFSDRETFAPGPRPEGSARMEVTGLNGLIDTLSEMGLVPQEQLTGLRLGLGMVTEVTGEDVLESRVEVTPEGNVLVNGMRVR
ncbi:DUF2125 domain-containing protein [Histidinibacterium aquaticum]|uniref:DUF2125 domain-containing protein n=1 Tax=Histidinibacterium aquaticum TaxID=2613962 RepID=A0A5J5GCS4_9RHOB|nr:DUF2125 domain-containing protein [Histidinibacterium aquaticum]KAA9005979.1 DUF2125 domain-containing protein [Histidinibacterium aquaticum]